MEIGIEEVVMAEEVKKESDAKLSSVLNKITQKSTIIPASKIEGTMLDNVNYVIKKHRRKDREFGDNAILLNGFDGARHTNSSIHDLTIVSFSCLLYSIVWGQETSSASSKDLLT